MLRYFSYLLLRFRILICHVGETGSYLFLNFTGDYVFKIYTSHLGQ
jgi:hypothetical protein